MKELLLKNSYIISEFKKILKSKIDSCIHRKDELLRLPYISVDCDELNKLEYLIFDYKKLLIDIEMIENEIEIDE